MKVKIVIILVSIFLLCGCHKKNYDVQIKTIIEENPHYKIGINYPFLNNKDIDSTISNYISSSYDNFLNKQSNKKSLDTLEELNIDYTFFQNEEIISITLFKVDNLEKEIKTYNYNVKEESFISIEDLTSSTLLYDKASTYLFKRFGNILDISLVQQNLKTTLFSLDHEYLYLYYLPYSISSNYSDFIILDIPLNELNISFDKVQTTSLEIENTIDSEKVNSIIDTNSKVVAITFDDGPSSYTDDIITILKENDAVATFFILGNKVKTYEEVLKKSIEFGNELGNHTYNHKWLTKLTDEEIKKQIEDTQNIIKDTLGYTPRLFRPSYGSINKRVRKDINLDVILWNIDTMDWKYKSVDTIVNRAVRNVNDGSIILMHETYQRTKDALPKILSILKEKGFIFVTISELKEINTLRKLNE
jgi:peptidoglycan/xylan/chitin deacetylase (PgdA/CDA1 family)